MTNLAKAKKDKKKLQEKKIKKNIMIQGTASNVGKSIIATALCRIFAQDNLKVAPFKSWNMSLNSFVTSTGGEIGIAQAIQAEAARVKPTVDMQPILVKPKGKGLSQVIVRGKAIGDQDYKKKDLDYIKWALEIIRGSISNLEKDYDLIVMEGAGSPAEVNRKKEDLANMKVALLNKTPVILVTDIDRGGAFASLVGTLRLLEPAEQDLIKGFIINRFRGDFDLLKPGLDFLENYTKKPVLGVIPYLKEINLPEEDSVSLHKRTIVNNNDIETEIEKGTELKIGVINLPHISNFTDFASLQAEGDVNLKYISEPIELNNLDLLIIPGTKSTTVDLNYLKKTGMAAKIIELNAQGLPVIGICGGYQMLGKKLLDPEHTDGEIEEIKGLGLLPVETVFLAVKTTHQVEAKIKKTGGFLDSLEGEIIKGYEIHMGETKFTSPSSHPFEIRERSQEKVKIKDGAIAIDSFTFGTYLHGLFNNDNFRRKFLDQVRKRKGLKLSQRDYSYQEKLEADYDKLAESVRENLRINLIYQIINEGSR